jgi:alkyl hydroperoxide reductase subunit F
MVESIEFFNKQNNDIESINVDGVFILIGLVPITDYLEGSNIALNQRKEIIVDKYNATNVEGIYAAGDCTDQVYKQIIISMGSGASAALGAFDYLLRSK